MPIKISRIGLLIKMPHYADIHCHFLNQFIGKTLSHVSPPWWCSSSVCTEKSWSVRKGALVHGKITLPSTYNPSWEYLSHCEYPECNLVFCISCWCVTYKWINVQIIVTPLCVIPDNTEQIINTVFKIFGNVPTLFFFWPTIDTNNKWINLETLHQTQNWPYSSMLNKIGIVSPLLH